MVVLTGDAGHGKTHLCGQLLSDLLEQPVDPALAAKLAADGTGDVDLALLESVRALRIIKDLSEFSPDAGAERLGSALRTEDCVTVVCANEGRLRSAAERARLDGVLSALDGSIQSGQSRSSDGAITILNLNHQSVAATSPADDNIFRQLVSAWVSEPNPWSACDGCSSREHCPILANRMVLAENHDDGPLGGIELLLRTAERTGHVITIRELLIFVAHVITGGLRCGDVHARTDLRTEDDWQWEYLFHEAAFGDRIPHSVRRELDVFAGISKLDPARRALRAVDSRLDPKLGPTFDPPFRPDLGSAPTTVAAKRRESEQQVRMWRFLRRHDFFSPPNRRSEPSVPSPSDRLGLQYLVEFDEVVAGEASTEVRNSLLRGLEAVQGVHRSGVHSFVLVDPALSGSSGDAVIVSDTVSLNQVRLMSEREASRARSVSGPAPDVHERVDWIDRRIVISFGGPEAPAERSMALSLHEFEYVLRTARGLRSTAFFAPEVRRFRHGSRTWFMPIVPQTQ